jgi:hypothetical protein
METDYGILEDDVFTSHSGQAYYVGEGKEHLLEIISIVAKVVEGDVSFEKCIRIIEEHL